MGGWVVKQQQIKNGNIIGSTSPSPQFGRKSSHYIKTKCVCVCAVSALVYVTQRNESDLLLRGSRIEEMCIDW